MDTTDQEYVVGSLTKDKKYFIRVAAVNKIGQGPFVALDEAVTAKSEFDPPGPPQNPQVSDNKHLIHKEDILYIKNFTAN